jgi:hypothetical protein
MSCIANKSFFKLKIKIEIKLDSKRMDYQTLFNAIMKLNTRVEELDFHVGEIKEMLVKQRNDELMKRLESLESSMKKQHLKLDALSAIDPVPVVVAPTTATTIKVAGARGKKREDNLKDEDSTVDEPVLESSASKNPVFNNVTEYFKWLFSNNTELLFEKNVLTKEFVDEIRDKNKDKLDKKKNGLVFQKSLAYAIWKALPQSNRDIVYAMKEQNATDQQKNNSTEVQEESEESE